MGLIQIVSIGSLPIHACVAPDGYRQPQITLKVINSMGMAGQIFHWDNFIASLSEINTGTFCIQDETTVTYEDLINSYVGTSQQFITTNGYSIDDTFTAFIESAIPVYHACICSEDDTQDTYLTIKWKMVLYRN